jgi:hypothetical protein
MARMTAELTNGTTLTSTVERPCKGRG